MSRTATRPIRPIRRAVTAAAACAAVLGLCAAATAPATAAPSAPGTTGTAAVRTAPAPAAVPAAVPGPRYTARQIHTFLKIFYGQHGPGRFARTYGVSDELKERAAQHPESDVLLCAQNRPRSIGIGPVTTAQSAGVGWATVTTHWAQGPAATDSFTAYVALDASRPMQLLDVACDVEG